MMEEAEVAKQVNPEMERTATQRARDRAAAARWDLDIAVFLFAVLIIAIVLFALIGRSSLWLMVLSRILLIPLIAGLGYEVIRFGAAHTTNRLIRAILAPGLWLQGLTTREPDDSQLEVALAALNKAVEADQLETAQPTS